MPLGGSTEGGNRWCGVGDTSPSDVLESLFGGGAVAAVGICDEMVVIVLATRTVVAIRNGGKQAHWDMGTTLAYAYY